LRIHTSCTVALTSTPVVGTAMCACVQCVVVVWLPQAPVTRITCSQRM
jgi:hypothetical protein